MNETAAILIGLWNIVTAPLLLYAVMSSGFLMYPLWLRIGFAVAAVGQFMQAFFNFAGVNQLEGFGLMWFLKDVGLGIVAIAIISDKMTEKFTEDRRQKLEVLFESDIDVEKDGGNSNVESPSERDSADHK